MKLKVLVVMNGQHSLFPQQLKLLNKKFPKWDFLKVPSEGWTLKDMIKIVADNDNTHFVFASPVPALMALIIQVIHSLTGIHEVYPNVFLSVFHNDKRDAKEIVLPNGGKKVVHTVPQEGWVIV